MIVHNDNLGITIAILAIGFLIVSLLMGKSDEQPQVEDPQVAIARYDAQKADADATARVGEAEAWAGARQTLYRQLPLLAIVLAGAIVAGLVIYFVGRTGVEMAQRGNLQLSLGASHVVPNWQQLEDAAKERGCHLEFDGAWLLLVNDESSQVVKRKLLEG